MKADDIIRELREALDAIPEDEREWSLRMRPMRVLADVRDGLGEYVADMAMAEDARYIAAASPARMAVLLDYIDDQRREAVAEALREAGVCPTCRGKGCWPCAGKGRVRPDDAPSLWQTGSPPEPGVYITSYADTPPDEDWTGIDYWDGDEWEETMDDRTPDFWMPLPPTPRATP